MHLIHQVLFLLASLNPSEPVADRDADGLSDYRETHKYRTDPERADSDGDGVPDGDWLERREFSYVVRSVVQVMRPVTVEFLDDDYQDVRVLDETSAYVELEVIHYPFSTAGQEVPADPDWREHGDDPALEPWLAAGPTSDWDKNLRRDLEQALRKDGIDVRKLDGRTLVEKVSSWLLVRTEHVDGFTTFSTAFDAKGRPFVPEELIAHVNGGNPPTKEDWEREISASGMYEHRTRGSCTSSAIYLSGCLRAVGVPTRTVLCIPIADAGDEREMSLVQTGIENDFVRRTVLAGLAGLEHSWASHTFNEVFLGGRWWRLDYDQLGVGILRKERFGLITHVGTFRDWADARMSETVGARQSKRERDAVFDGQNPYSMISLRDERGVHCSFELPVVDPLQATIEGYTWTDDKRLSKEVKASIEREQRFGLLAYVSGPQSPSGLRDLLDLADLRVYLEADGHATLSIHFDRGCWWFDEPASMLYLSFGPSDRENLEEGVEYRLRCRNESREARFEVASDLVVERDS